MMLKKITMLVLGLLIGVGFGALLHERGVSFSSVRNYVLGLSEDYQSDSEEAALVKEHVALLNVVAQTASTTTHAENVHGEKAAKIPVLVYHSVRPHIAGESAYQDAYDVSPELLESELVYIAKGGYTTIAFADVEKYWKDGTPLPTKPVILSFDDGWKNEYTYAFPLLKKYHMKATFFIFTNPIDHKKSHWMSWAEVLEMDKAGMEIGGHTRTHPVLTKIVTDKELDKEIAGGKAIIEQRLGHSIFVFAYPFGLKDARVEAAVTRAGFTLARTVLSGVWNDPATTLDLHGTLSSDKLTDFTKLLNKP